MNPSTQGPTLEQLQKVGSVMRFSSLEHKFIICTCFASRTYTAHSWSCHFYCVFNLSTPKRNSFFVLFYFIRQHFPFSSSRRGETLNSGRSVRRRSSARGGRRRGGNRRSRRGGRRRISSDASRLAREFYI